jgi:hypothetical protein
VTGVTLPLPYHPRHRATPVSPVLTGAVARWATHPADPSDSAVRPGLAQILHYSKRNIAPRALGGRRMDLSWITDRSLRISPRARLVADGDVEALRRKLEQISWQPENGFLKDQVAERAPQFGARSARAA